MFNAAVVAGCYCLNVATTALQFTLELKPYSAAKDPVELAMLVSVAARDEPVS